MKRRIGLSIALVLSVVMVSLIGSNWTVNATQGGGADFTRFTADSGVVTLGPNQILRITVANGLDAATVRLRRLEYLQGTCDGGVCKHSISLQTVSNPISLAPGEAASYDLGDTATREVRSVITSNRRGLKVNVLIINASTGEVVSFFDIFTE